MWPVALWATLSSLRCLNGGFHFGAGVEAKVSKSAYVRAEYVRTNYDNYAYSDGVDSLSIDGHRDQAVLGFGLRF